MSIENTNDNRETAATAGRLKRLVIPNNAVDFNVNHYVYVKLLKHGKEELKRQHDVFYESIGINKDYRPPEEDENGWSAWQFHDIMSRLGHMMTLGGRLPFKTDIKFESKV